MLAFRMEEKNPYIVVLEIHHRIFLIVNTVFLIIVNKDQFNDMNITMPCLYEYNIALRI